MEYHFIQRGSNRHLLVNSLETQLENCIADYNKPENVKKFEDNARRLMYSAPKYCSKLLAELMQDNMKCAKVLDVASGSGQVGRELHKAGFVNIHALDGSWAMLEACRKKGVYSGYLCSVIDNNQGLPVSNESYDAVITSGAVLEHHLPASCQSELVRVTKQGGYCVIAYSCDVMSTDYGRAWQTEARHLVDDRSWKRLCQIAIPDFYAGIPGAVEVFQVL